MYGPTSTYSSSEAQKPFSVSRRPWIGQKPLAVRMLCYAYAMLCYAMHCLQVSLLHSVDANTGAEEIQVFLWRLWWQNGSSGAQITMQVYAFAGTSIAAV